MISIAPKYRNFRSETEWNGFLQHDKFREKCICKGWTNRIGDLPFLTFSIKVFLISGNGSWCDLTYRESDILGKSVLLIQKFSSNGSLWRLLDGQLKPLVVVFLHLLISFVVTNDDIEAYHFLQQVVGTFVLCARSR